MRRLLLVVFGFYLILGTAFVVIYKTTDKQITILSVKQEMTRVLVGDETLEFSIYADHTDSFLFDAGEIDNARIESETLITDIEILSFTVQEEEYTFREGTYRRISIRTCFGRFSFDDETELYYPESVLSIQYSNQSCIGIPIGNLVILIRDELTSAHFDLIRMAGVPDAGNGLLGVLVALDNKYDQEIGLSSFETLSRNIKFDESKIQVLDEWVPSTTIDAVDGLTVRTIDLEGDSLSLDGTIVLYLPLQEEGESYPWNRLPIRIGYTFLGRTYSLQIDDFVFFNLQSTALEVYGNAVSVIQYRYDERQ